MSVRSAAATRLVSTALVWILTISGSAYAGSLSPAPAWTNEVFQTEAFNGNSVDSAGDINRDGYGDVIVGAPLYDSPSTSAGLARVFYGNATGVATTAAWTVTGPGGTGAEFGTAVAGAGDVNGDGYPDVLVSAVGEDLTCCYSYQGAVYLYLGTATGLATTPARSYGPGPQGFIYFGESVTALGDVNRDGFADFAVGSRQYTNGQSSEGAVFIYYGAATPPSAPALIIESNVSFAVQGIVVRAGDVNGDTYPDVMIRGGNRLYLYYGSATGLPATPSWTAAPSYVSTSNFSPIGALGDINNDGYDDIAASDAAGSGGFQVYLGSPSGPPTAPSMAFSPLPAGNYVHRITGVGDVDGDGYDDVVGVASNWSNGQTAEGRAFLFRGGAAGLASSYNWTAESNYANGAMGPVAAAGDVNHDGLADVILGATGYANHGAAYVYLGSAAACTPPPAPGSLVVTATANSELTLNWTVVPSAHHSVIYRALAACGAGSYTRLAETETNVGTYVDRTALPGGLYSYVVGAATAANICESGPSPCDDETVTGTCTVKPAFAGLQSVTPTDCGLVLSWSAATSGCPVPGNIRYHIYRGGSGFTPGSFSRVASCVSGTAFTAPMFSGAGDYFIVRAEENGCTAANEETNTVSRNGASILNYSDNLELPRTTIKDAWFLTSGPVQRSTCKAAGGSYSYRLGGGSFCNTYNAFEDATLTLGGNGSIDPAVNGFRIPAGWTNVRLNFDAYYSTVANRDGALLQYSINSPNAWNNVPTGATAGQPYIIFGGYNGTILSGTVPAWTGTPSSFFNGVSVNLDALAGNRVWFRWVWKTAGSSSTNGGFFIDNIAVTGSSTTLQSVTISANGGTTFCWNATGPQVTAVPNGGGPWVNYSWGYRTTPGGPITTVSSVHQSTHTLSGTQFQEGAGTYYVVATVTPTCGGEMVSNELAVTVTDTPPVPAIAPSGPTTFCDGGSVTLTAPAGYTYLWSPGGQTTQSILVTQPGSYTVRVSLATGCSSTSAPTVVTVNQLPGSTITASGPTTFCEGGSVTLTAAAGASWLWSTGETTQSIVAAASSTYSVTVTSASGCSSTSAPATVTVNPVPAASVSGTAAICAGGSAIVSAALTGTGPWNVTWSDGFVQNGVAASPATRVVSPASTATYSVTAVSDSFCTGTASGSATVTVNPNPPASITALTPYESTATIVSQANGIVEVCGSGTIRLVPSIVAGATYQWSTGAATGALDITASGTYTVTITSAAGCASSASVVVNYTNYPAQPTVGATATELCPAGGSVTLTASAADGWLWSNGATTQSIVVTEPGTYTVRARTNLCESQPSDSVVITTGISTIETSGTTTLCTNGSVTLTATGGTSWLWSNGATTQSIVVSDPGTFSVTTTNNGCTMPQSSPVTVTRRAVSIDAGGPTTFCAPGSVTLTANAGTSWLWSTGATTQSIVASASGSYSVTATFADGCTVQSAPVAVEGRQLAVSVAADRNTVCPGGTISITSSVSGGTASAYQWYQGGSYTPIAGATSPSYTFSPTVDGFVYLKVTDALGCEATSNSIQYTIQPAIDATITAPASVCAGASGTASVAATANTSYAWTITGATPATANTPSVLFTPTGSGPVTLSVTVSNPGCSGTSAKSVTVNALPDATITPSGPTTFCSGGSVTLTAPAGGTYLWSTGATTQSIAVNASGSYGVTVTNANGCSATSAPTAVTVNALPTATITPSGPTAFCSGGSVTLTASAGSSWLWSTGATTQSIAVSASGSYSVTVTNASGCSATSAPTAVTVNALPAAAITPSGPTTFCSGGSVTLTASAGSSWLWSTGATTQSIAVSASGSYSVIVTNANGCSATSTPTAVIVNALPAATITPSGPTTFCAGGSVTLTASAGSSWVWSTGATTQSIAVNASGSYSVTVTNATGCSATSAPVTVTVNAKPATPAITPSGPTAFCAGGSVTLTAPAGFTYLWSTGATTQSINVNTSGSYSVTVTNASGCSSTSAATTVTVNAATAITVQPQSKTIPKNTSTTLSVTATGTGTLAYQWYRGTSPSTATPVSGATSASYTTPSLSKGTYTYWVRVTGTCGAVNSNTATITAN